MSHRQRKTKWFTVSCALLTIISNVHEQLWGDISSLMNLWWCKLECTYVERIWTDDERNESSTTMVAVHSAVLATHSDGSDGSGNQVICSFLEQVWSIYIWSRWVFSQSYHICIHYKSTAAEATLDLFSGGLSRMHLAEEKCSARRA